MTNPPNRSFKLSQPAQVDVYMAALDHPMKPVMEALRVIILAAHPAIGEEIKWNAPAFFYAGDMADFEPKLYKRHFIVFNLFKKDCLRLVFPSGARIGDTSGLLTGNYADGRRLALFSTIEEVRVHTPALQRAITSWLDTLEMD